MDFSAANPSGWEVAGFFDAEDTVSWERTPESETESLRGTEQLACIKIKPIPNKQLPFLNKYCFSIDSFFLELRPIENPSVP